MIPLVLIARLLSNKWRIRVERLNIVKIELMVLVFVLPSVVKAMATGCQIR